jgi:hypothetical protein
VIVDMNIFGRLVMKMRWLRDMLKLMEDYRDHKEDLD